MIGENGFESLIWFMGFVEDNSDELNGRIRVRAFGFHPPFADGTVLTEDLPWAHVVRDSKFSSIPDLGDLVIGFFLDGRDAQHPIVIGTINSAKFSAPSSNPNYNPESYNPDGTPGASGDGVGGTDRSKYAYQYFINKGFTPEQAAGIVGNLQQESGPNLDSLYNPAGGGDGARGIAQWRGVRTNKFVELYGTTPDLATLDQQLDFVMYEFTNPIPGASTKPLRAYTGIKSSTSAAESAAIFDELYEINGGGSRQSRVNNASSLLQQFAGTEPQPPIEGENPYLAPSQDVVSNYGNPAMPSAINGENYEFSPALAGSVARRSGATASGHTVDEPGIPPPGGKDTSVWETRYGGSHIAMSGKNTSDEYINIIHANGSRVTIDGNGNVTVKAMGKLHLGSESNIEESADGAKVGMYPKGYTVDISDGKCNITSAGDMNFTTHGNMNINVAGSLAMNVSDNIDITGARIALTAKADSIDFLAVNKIAIQSSGGEIGISSEGALYLQSAGDMNLKGSGMVKLGGSQVHLNSAGNAPADAVTAIAAATINAELPEKKVVSDDSAANMATPPGISADMVDDTGGTVIDSSNMSLF
jgi:hypothetical protein